MTYVKKSPETKICYRKSCGAEFTTSYSRQRFCSEACRLEFIRQVNELGKCPNCGGELL
jgi:hypothetical protein